VVFMVYSGGGLGSRPFQSESE